MSCEFLELLVVLGWLIHLLQHYFSDQALDFTGSLHNLTPYHSFGSHVLCGSTNQKFQSLKKPFLSLHNLTVSQPSSSSFEDLWTEISDASSRMAPRGPHKHWCKICNKSFPSGRALGGHMSCHWRIDRTLKSTLSPPAAAVDVHASLLDPCDENPSLPSLDAQCLKCSKVLSTCQSVRGHMRIRNEKDMMPKPIEESGGLLESSANADNDHDLNAMIFSPVKRKRSKRGMPALNFEDMDAAVTLVMLADHSDRMTSYGDCCGGDKDDNSSTANLLKLEKLNMFDHVLVLSDESTEPKTDNNSDYEDIYGDRVRKNNLNLVADVPKEVQLNAFDLGLDADAEFKTPGANSSVEELKFHLSATENFKSHQCKVCGKSLRSGNALGGHMRYHYVRRCKPRQEVADCPDSAVMEEHKHKHVLDSGSLDCNLPALIDGDCIHADVKS
ncbi:hypothetical protein ACP4OV_023162 [Aristida adscensionis]